MPDVDAERTKRNADLSRRFEAVAPRYGFLIRGVLQEQDDGDRITIPQFRTMQTLVQLSGDGATNLELARRIAVSPPAMTAMIDGLVERGLVTRTTDPENRRQVLILLTATGEERLEAATAAIEHRMSKGIAQLSDAEAKELERGIAALEKIFGIVSPEIQD